MSSGVATGEVSVERTGDVRPLPVADALAALEAADNPHQRRDRIVECFRTVVRYHAALALAARLQFGPGPDGDAPELHDLLRALRRRHLTDGQWVQLTRTLLKPWAARPEAHVLPELVELMCGKRSKLPRLIDGLLEMRRVETVAHGGSGGAGAIAEVLARRGPQLERLLGLFAPMWARARLAVPLAVSATPGEPQRAWSLVGDTPPRGLWRRVALIDGAALAPGQPVLIDDGGKPLLALHPIALVRRPSPEVPEELFVLDGGGKRGARYVAFPSTAEHGEGTLWDELEPILAGDDADEAEAAGGATRPYRGLTSFGPEHTKLFFGREREIEELANRIRRYPLVTVTGRSGSGKSSMLHAGVCPRLADHRVITVRPGAHPLRALAARLAPVIDAPGADPAIAEVLAEAPETLGTVLERWCRASSECLLLVIDQAEELFTLCDDADEREGAAAALASAGLDPDGPLRVVLSLREDFFARLAQLGPLRGQYDRQVAVVTTPEREAMARTLVAPAAVFGYELEDPALVAAMIDPIANEPAGLALLQFCADRMWDARDRAWKRLTWAAYRELGGVEGALAAHADKVLDRFTAAQQHVARLLLIRLVTAEGTRAVVPRDELVGTGAGRADADAVIDALVEARLLTVREADDRRGSAALELAHEALIRHWDRLRLWLEEDHELVIVRHRVADAAAHWRAEGGRRDFLLGDGKPLVEAEALLAAYPEMLATHEVRLIEASRARARGRARLKRTAIAGLVMLTAAASVAAWVALGQRRQAQERAREVAARSDDLMLQRASDALDSDPTEAIAWLGEIELGARSAPRARMIAADALSRGISTQVLRFPDRAPARLQLEADAVVYLAPGNRLVRRPLSGAAPIELAAARPAPFTSVDIDPAWRVAGIAGDDGVAIVDLARGTTTPLTVTGHEIIRAIPSPDGSRALLLDRHGDLHSLEVGGALRAVARGPFEPRSPLIAMTPDKRRIAYVHGDGSGAIVDAEGDARWAIEPATTKPGVSGSSAAALAPNGAYVAIADPDGALRIVAVADGRARRIESFGPPASAAVFSRDGSTLVTVHGQGLLHVWDMDTGFMTQRLRTGGVEISSAIVSDDGSLVAAPTDDGPIVVWDARSGEQLMLRGHRDVVNAIDFSADGRTLASSSFDGDLRIWQLPTERARVIEASPSAIEWVGFAGERAVTVSEVSVSIWSLDGGRQDKFPPGDDDPFALRLPALDEELPEVEPEAWVRADPVTGCIVRAGTRLERWTPEGGAQTVLEEHGGLERASCAADRLALWAEWDPRIRVIDGRGQLVADLTGDAPRPGDLPRPRAVALSPDGDRVVELDGRGAVRLWSAPAWQPRLLGEGLGELGLPAWSADGARLAVPHGTAIEVWRVSDGNRTTLEAHTKEVSAVTFAPGGELVASVGADATVRLWRLGSAQPRTLAVRTPLQKAAFSRDGRTLVTLAYDGEARVWDVASGQGRALPAQAHSLRSIAVSDDGEHIAGGGDRGALHLWTRDLPGEPAALAAHLRAVSPLGLDPVTSQLAATRVE